MSRSRSLRSRSGCSLSISSTRHRSRWHSASLYDFPITSILLRFLPFASGCRLILRPDHIAQPVPDHMCAHPDRSQYPLLLAALDRRDRDPPPAHHLRTGKKTIVNRIHLRQLYGIAILLSTMLAIFRDAFGVAINYGFRYR